MIIKPFFPTWRERPRTSGFSDLHGSSVSIRGINDTKIRYRRFVLCVKFSRILLLPFSPNLLFFTTQFSAEDYSNRTTVPVHKYYFYHDISWFNTINIVLWDALTQESKMLANPIFFFCILLADSTQECVGHSKEPSTNLATHLRTYFYLFGCIVNIMLWDALTQESKMWTNPIFFSF